MIVFKRGNLFADDAEALVNAVNCVGVMDGGIALHFKRAYPDMFDAYKRACAEGEVRVGKMHVFKTDFSEHPAYIINFPTLHHWEDPSLLEHIELGLLDLVKVIKERGIKSIAIPALGCGVGGLLWTDVRSLMETAFDEVKNVKVHIYEPL